MSLYIQGRYQNTNNQRSCKGCLTGQYQDVNTQSSCKGCGVGKFGDVITDSVLQVDYTGSTDPCGVGGWYWTWINYNTNKIISPQQSEGMIFSSGQIIFTKAGVVNFKATIGGVSGYPYRYISCPIFPAAAIDCNCPSPDGTDINLGSSIDCRTDFEWWSPATSFFNAGHPDSCCAGEGSGVGYNSYSIVTYEKHVLPGESIRCFGKSAHSWSKGGKMEATFTPDGLTICKGCTAVGLLHISLDI